MTGKKLLVLVLVLLLLFSSPLFALDYLYPAKIVRVIDGDTIIVDLNLGLDVFLNDQRIRLYGIDAWEVTGTEKEKGLKAKEYLEARLQEDKIEVEMRPEWTKNKTGKDSFGRWLGIVYVDTVNINAELMEKGYAEKHEGDLDDTERSTRMSDLLGVVLAVAPLAAASAALIAAIAALRGVGAAKDAAEATRKASEGQLFMQIRTAYSSEKMLWGMRELKGFEKDYGRNYAKEFGEGLRSDYPRVKRYDAARRRFAHWRHAVRMLRKYKFLSKELFRDLWKKNQWKFYKKYIKPLEDKIREDMEEINK